MLNVKFKFTRLLTAILSICCLQAIGQSKLQSTLYMIDIYQHNPAYAGFDRSLSANFNYRTQWTGLLENPNALNANVHMPFYLWNGGIGLKIENHSDGGFKKTGVSLSFNRVQSFERGIISGGLSLGMQQISIDGSIIRTPDGIYGNGEFSHEDPILPTFSANAVMPIWTLGFFMQSDIIDLGISLENLIVPMTKIEQINYKAPKSLALYAALPLLVNGLEIRPSLYIKSNLINIQTDLSVLVKNGNIFGGLGLRGFNENSLESITFLGGIKLNEHYTLSYSYDFIINDIGDFSQGTHEININYNLNKLIGIGLPPEIIYNPRHF